MFKNKIIIGMFAFACILIFSNTNVHASAENTINEGIFAESVDLSGMTAEEAKQAIHAYVQEISELEITLELMDDIEVIVTPEEVGLCWVNPEIVDDAFALGKKGNLIKRYKEMQDISNNPQVFEIIWSVDDTLINEVIQEKCSVNNYPETDFSLTHTDGVFTVVDGSSGYSVNENESAKIIKNYFENEWEYEEDSLTLAIDEIEPKGSVEELGKVKDLIGWYRTSFATSGAARSANVTNGCNLINGTLLYPGESFSTYEVVSPFTEENGYFMAGSYLNGMVVDSLGGGICQVSTTLYNAVLRAELQIDERFSHSMIVGYVQISGDAAISGTSKDFKFTNNTEYPIYIEGTISADKRVAFSIYGVEDRPSNRTLSFETEITYEEIPTTEKIVADPAQPIGYISIQSAHTGYKATLWKVISVDGVESNRVKANTSSYRSAPRTATVGTATADPMAAAEIAAAIGTGSIDHVNNVAATLAAQAAVVAQ